MARPKRAKTDKYGEKKQRFMFMLTETASGDLEKASEEIGVTRSELLERLVRRFLEELLAEEKETTSEPRDRTLTPGGAA